MSAFVFFEVGIALLLVLFVWGWLYWHRPKDDHPAEPEAPHQLP